MPKATIPTEIDKALQYLIEAVESQGHGDEMLIAILRELTDLVKESQPLGGALTAEQTAFLIESGTFTAESLATTEASVARGDLAELERKTRLEAITGSLSTAEVAEQLGIDASSVRHRQAKGRLYSFKAGGKLRYPAWQFSDDPEQPVLPGLSRLVKAFPEDMHPASIQNFMATLQDDLVLSDRWTTPREWLQLGRNVQDVVDILDSILQS